MLSPRENILRALHRSEPEWVPFHLQFTDPMREIFEQKVGHYEAEGNLVEEFFDFDFRGTQAGSFEDQDKSVFLPYYDGKFPENAEIDIYGIAHRKGSTPYYSKMVHPMARLQTPKEIDEYPLPDITAEWRRKELERNIAEIHRRGYAAQVSSGTTHLFELAWGLRGMEQFLVDLVENEPMAARLLDRLTEINLTHTRWAAEAGADILITGDDVATQRGMMMSPQLWRKWFKPRLKAIYSTAKKANPDILTWYHSDGDCRAVIPELVEVGLDILNPVQPECMDPVEIKKTYGDRLAFWGTIGTQTTMPFGTPDEVKRVVKERIETVGRNGGLLLAPTHVIEPDVPWENIHAFVEACREYGGRPGRNV